MNLILHGYERESGLCSMVKRLKLKAPRFESHQRRKTFTPTTKADDGLNHQFFFYFRILLKQEIFKVLLSKIIQNYFLDPNNATYNTVCIMK